MSENLSVRDDEEQKIERGLRGESEATSAI